MGFAFYAILIQFMYLFLRQGLFKNYFIFLQICNYGAIIRNHIRIVHFQFFRVSSHCWRWSPRCQNNIHSFFLRFKKHFLIFFRNFMVVCQQGIIHVYHQHLIFHLFYLITRQFIKKKTLIS